LLGRNELKRALQRRDRKNYLFYDSRHSKSPVARPENEVIGNQVKGQLDCKPEVDYGLPGPVSGKRIVLCILMTVAS
jgi:hypothetical protein